MVLSSEDDSSLSSRCSEVQSTIPLRLSVLGFTARQITALFLSHTLLLLLQMIDRICVKVQDHLNSLRNSETDVVLDDVKTAENLMKDARNSKTVTGHFTLGI